MIKKRPFLKWAGGKYRCLEHILPCLPKANRLIEPFAGSGVVFLNANYDNYTLADKNQDLIYLYQYVQKEGDSFINYCEKLFTPYNNCNKIYYQLRTHFNQCVEERERAALFLYLNRHGYNGLCRYNLKGQYNVPFGRYKKPYFPRQELINFHLKSQMATLVCTDFHNTFAHAQAGDVIYCDPPYAPIDQLSNFSSYTQIKFGEKEQIMLAELARDASKRGIPVIISNHDTPFTRLHYKTSRIKSFSVRRNISCNKSGRHLIKELIAVFQR
jgi:DNA adenine methylase